MHMDNPAVRIQETQLILDRLEKRLEKYYKPAEEQSSSPEGDDLKDIKARLLKNIGRTNTPKEDCAVPELKYSRSLDCRPPLPPRDSPKKDLENSSGDRRLELAGEIKDLRDKLERVEKRHRVKEVKLEREVHKLKADLQKSSKLNRLLIKQLSPPSRPSKKDTIKPLGKKSAQLSRTLKSSKHL